MESAVTKQRLAVKNIFLTKLVFESFARPIIFKNFVGFDRFFFTHVQSPVSTDGS